MVLKGLIAAVLLGLPAGAGAQPAADDKAAADRLAAVSARAKAAFEAKKYAEAVALYQEAYRLEPVATLLYNIAYLYDAHLDERALARDFYRRYVNAPDAEASARLKAFERIAVFDADDAREAKAKAAVATARADTPRVDPAPVAQPISSPAPAPAAVVASAAPASVSGRAGQTSGLGGDTLTTIFFGVGGAALLTSGISAALVADTHDEYLAARTPGARTDLAEKGERQALVADITLTVGLAAVAAGVWFWLSEDDDAAATSWVPTTVNGEPGVVFGRAF